MDLIRELHPLFEDHVGLETKEEALRFSQTIMGISFNAMIVKYVINHMYDDEGEGHLLPKNYIRE